METRHDRFEQLFRANYAAVRAYALRRAPAHVAQDVVAETFLVAWRRLEAVPDDALPWLKARAAAARAALDPRDRGGGRCSGGGGRRLRRLGR